MMAVSFIEMFSYGFIVRALIVGTLVALCAALLGVSLVLKRYSMIGDGLSHVGFGAIAIALVMNMAPLSVAIPVVVLAAFLLLRVSTNSKIRGDAAIAMISTGTLAFGVFAISLKSGMNVDMSSFMFGSILAMDSGDVVLSVVLSVLVLILFVIFYPRIFAVTFDENFARATGVKVEVYNGLLAFLSAITIVLGMRMMGALLISALIIFPPLSAMQIFKTFRQVVISSALLSVVCFVAGLILSYIVAAPTGASVVLMNVAAFTVSFIIRLVRQRA